MRSEKTFNLRTVVLVGVLSALVFALSSLEIVIPISTDTATRIHFGNIMCLLSGVLFGPLVGGLSAGFGSMLYDLTHPLYISEFWITFLTKFAMGFVAGFLATRPLGKAKMMPRALFSALGGQITYIILYLLKTTIMQRFVMMLDWRAVGIVVAGKGAVSALNGLVAVVCCTLIAPVLQASLNAAGFFKRGAGHSPG